MERLAIKIDQYEQSIQDHQNILEQHLMKIILLADGEWSHKLSLSKLSDPKTTEQERKEVTNYINK